MVTMKQLHFSRWGICGCMSWVWHLSLWSLWCGNADVFWQWRQKLCLFCQVRVLDFIWCERHFLWDSTCFWWFCVWSTNRFTKMLCLALWFLHHFWLTENSSGLTKQRNDFRIFRWGPECLRAQTRDVSLFIKGAPTPAYLCSVSRVSDENCFACLRHLPVFHLREVQKWHKDKKPVHNW